RALTRLAETLPIMPGEEDPMYAEARRADALVALASNQIANDADPDRATVVIHAHVVPGTSRAAFEIEGGPVIHPRTAERLLCHSRVQVVAEDASGNALGMARTAREPSPAVLRQLRHRDFGCTTCPSSTPGVASHDHPISHRSSPPGAGTRHLAVRRSRRLRGTELRHLPADALAGLGGGGVVPHVRDGGVRQPLRGSARRS